MEGVIIQRIKTILEVNTISINAMAKKMNIPQPTLNAQLKGERALTCRVVDGILQSFPEVSAEWLLRGEGDMYKRQSGVQMPSVTSYNDSEWKAKYEELEKRYDQLLSIIGGGMRQRKANVG